jgi:hypothetical protein
MFAALSSLLIAAADPVAAGAMNTTAPRGVAVSVGAGLSTPTDLWIAPLVSARGLWYPRPDSSPFVGFGVFANLPRPQTYSTDTPEEIRQRWQRVRVTAAGGYRWHYDRASFWLEGGIGGGYLSLSTRGAYNRDYHYGDVAVFAQYRMGYAIPSAPNALQVWVALYTAQALKYHDGNGGSSGASPQSPVEIGLLIGVDVSATN